MSCRHASGLTVIHNCWIAPGPAMLANSTTLLPGRWMQGETFQPGPNSRAATAPVPSVAMPPCPLPPVGFSELIERVSALESRARLPRCSPKPLNAMLMLPDLHEARPPPNRQTCAHYLCQPTHWLTGLPAHTAGASDQQSKYSSLLRYPPLRMERTRVEHPTPRSDGA